MATPDQADPEAAEAAPGGQGYAQPQGEDVEQEPGSFDLETRVDFKRLSSRRTVLLLIALLLVGLAGAVFFFPGLKGLLPVGDSTEPERSVSQKEEAPDKGGDVENIGLQDVRQYMVQNEKIGQVLVIEGKAVNNSQAPKEMIKIQASLFDAQGNVLSQKEFLAGNTVSLFQLQVLSKEALDSALESKVGVLTNNTDIAPSEDVTFMTTFTNPPENLAEFSLKIVQARPVSDKS
jgi:hypothetical protein